MPVRLSHVIVTSSLVSALALALGAPVRAQISFAPPVSFQTPGIITAMTTGDLRHSGRNDVVVANSSTNSVAVLLNNGSSGSGWAGLAPAVNYTLAARPAAVAVADVDGNGFADIVVACSATAANAYVLMNNGNGTFTPGAPMTAGNSPSCVAVADVNNDGKPDIIMGNRSSSNVSVFLNAGAGIFLPAASYSIGNSFNTVGITAVDLNGDGKVDIVTANSGSGDLSVLMGNGDGTFGAAKSVPAGTGPQSIVSGDFNGDGRPDVAVSEYYDNTVMVFPNAGNGSFGTPTTASTGGSKAQTIARGDFNGDGHPDVVVANQTSANASVLVGNGDGTLKTPAALVATGTLSHLACAVADVNGDGLDDILVGCSNNAVWLLLNTTTSIASISLDTGVPSTGGVPTARVSHYVIGTINLSAPAPAGGVSVQVTSSDPTKAFVPPTVAVIPAGQTSTQFVLAAKALSSTPVIVTGSMNGNNASVPLLIVADQTGGGTSTGIKGDTNGDGMINIDDAVYALKLAEGATAG